MLFRSEDRAKIFAPFAALKGYEDAIAAKQKIVVPRVNLSEEVKEYLDRQLGRITHLLEEGTHPIIRVVFFEKDHTVQKKQEDEEEKGQYIQFTGMVAKLDTTSGWIQIVDRKLQLKDICKIESEELEEKA